MLVYKPAHGARVAKVDGYTVAIARFENVRSVWLNGACLGSGLETDEKALEFITSHSSNLTGV
jgi:hypothetical protein